MGARRLVEEALRRTLLDLAPQGRVFVGYSGGMDSTVLLHAARDVSPRPVTALHVNHGLAPQAREVGSATARGSAPSGGWVWNPARWR